MGRLAPKRSRRAARAAGRGTMNTLQTNDDNAAGRHARALAACACALLLLAAASRSPRAQSGRKSTPPSPSMSAGKAAPTPTPTPVRLPAGPIAEPPAPESKADKFPKPARQTDETKPTATPTPQPAAQASSRPGAEEVGDEEVVRISSNLVPVPASVVDAKGRAVTDLRLEDFELKVDGAVKPIGELSRAETPVSIALLFDNSSSLNATRAFERQAGIRFLKSVVRPVDRAAIYSISTEPLLAHPLTNDVHALVRTIENIGKALGATAP